MQIVFVTAIDGIMNGIMDTNDVIPLDQIKGSPRIGCTIVADGEGWKVSGNNVDADCVGGVCPVK